MARSDAVANAQRAGRFPTKPRLCRELRRQASFFLDFFLGGLAAPKTSLPGSSSRYAYALARLAGTNRKENNPAHTEAEEQIFGRAG